MRTFGDKRHSFNWPDVFCGYTNNDVKALKETHTHTPQNTDPNQRPGLIISSFTTGLLTEGALHLHASHVRESSLQNPTQPITILVHRRVYNMSM